MSSCTTILASLTTAFLSAVRKGHLEAAARPAGAAASSEGGSISRFGSNRSENFNNVYELNGGTQRPATDLGLRGRGLRPRQLMGAALWRPAPSSRDICGHYSPALTQRSASGKRRARCSRRGIAGSHSLGLFLI